MSHKETPACFTVGNTPGTSLPSTGGPGVKLFTVLGLGMIGWTGVLLWKRRETI